MKIILEINGARHDIEAELTPGGRVVFAWNGTRYDAEVRSTLPHRHSVLFPDGGHQELMAAPDREGGFTFFIHTHAMRVRMFDPLELEALKARKVVEGGLAWQLKAQMPGKVVSVTAAPGQEVQKGQPLLVVEAMKMQNEITAARPGRVKTVSVKPGDVVETGALLVEAEAI